MPNNRSQPTMDQNTLAELLGVSIDTLKKWRTRACADSPLALQPLPSASGNRQSTYSVDSIREWLERPANADYKARVIALLNPISFSDDHVEHIEALRQSPPAAAAWWANIHIDQQPDQQGEHQ